MKRLGHTAAILAFATFAAHAQTKAAPEDLSAKVMTTADGMTLYMFDKDADGASTCYEDCATKWMPYMALADAKMEKGWTQVGRKDGKMQWVYEGKPVYMFHSDKMKGDMLGDAMDGTWHVIRIK